MAKGVILLLFPGIRSLSIIFPTIFQKESGMHSTTLKYILGVTAFALLGILAVSGCKTDGENGTTRKREQRPQIDLKVPAFNRDSAYAFVAKQVSFGPRVPGTEPHVQCKDWLVGKLKALGLKVKVQSFTAEIHTGDKWPAFNIIGMKNPDAKQRLLFAAHWDSRYTADYDEDESRRDEAILGADDGASGVGVLIELARQLETLPDDFGVDIIFFDAEDQGYDAEVAEDSNPESWCLGAQYWARNLHTSGYSPMYGILLDMVGSKGARFPKEGYSMRFAPQVVDKVWSLAHRMGYGHYFDMTRTPGGVTDDHVFVNTIAKIPMIDIINKPPNSATGFGHYWHTHKDNMEVIDKRTLGAVGQVVTAVVFKEAAGKL